MLVLAEGKELNNRYLIKGPIGMGGHGSVWLASDQQLRRNVALKRLFKGVASSGSADLRRVVAEARKHAQLIHTNIVQVYDLIESDGESLIVMEYVDGFSLAKLLRDQVLRGELMPLDTSIRILKDVLSGVSFAHENKTIHRDLSPSNILISSRGISKVTDFGIATVLRVAGQDTPSSSIHAGTGNPQYMSPEQQRGEQLDETSDLFTIGIIGYLLLSGRHPFAHPSGLFSIPELLSSDFYVPESPLPALNSVALEQRLHLEYSAVIMRLLARERTARFGSARDALRALEAVVPFLECEKCEGRSPVHYRFCGFCGFPIEISEPVVEEIASNKNQIIQNGFEVESTGLGWWYSAISTYHKALRNDSNNLQMMCNLGIALNKVRRFEEAEKILTKAIKTGRGSSDVEATCLHDRAYARLQLKKYQQALQDVDAALRLRPNSVRAISLRARIHQHRKDPKPALDSATQVLKRIPDHTAALQLFDSAHKV